MNNDKNILLGHDDTDFYVMIDWVICRVNYFIYSRTLRKPTVRITFLENRTLIFRILNYFLIFWWFTRSKHHKKNVFTHNKKVIILCQERATNNSSKAALVKKKVRGKNKLIMMFNFHACHIKKAKSRDYSWKCFFTTYRKYFFRH